MMVCIVITSPEYHPDASFTIIRRRIESCIQESFQLTDEFSSADLHIHVGTPDTIPQKTHSIPLIAYTFAEATRVPFEWIVALNRCDHIWAGSRFTAQALQASGLTKSVTVIVPGIDCPIVPIDSFHVGDRPYTFFWQGTRLKRFLGGQEVDGDRKRGLLVEQAFRKAAIPGTRLILKYLPVEGQEYDIRYGSIWYVCRSLSSVQISELDAQSDAFIWPTMGEGFGLPPLEKLAQGVPAFPTFWSGPVDYMVDFPLPRLLPTQIVPVRFNGAVAEMADITVDTLATFMCNCFEQREALGGLRHVLHAIAQEKWDYRRQMRSRVISELQNVLASRK